MVMIEKFQNFCSNLTKNLFLGVYNDNSNLIQALESNYIDPNCWYSETIDFSEITFAFLVTACEESECGRPHLDMIS